MQHLDEGTLQAWLDRERSGLDAEARQEIEGHLAACRECRARLRELEEVDRRAGSILSSVEPADQSIPDFQAVVERSRSRSGRPRRSRWITTAWAASLVGAIAAGWMTNELYHGRTLPGAPGGGVEEAQAPAAVEIEPREEPPDEIAPESPEATGGEREPATLEDSPREAEARSTTGDASPSTGDASPPSPAAEGRADSGVTEIAEVAEEAAEEAEAETVTLTGRVTDESGRAVPSAQVSVPGSGIGTLTDRDGTFSLSLPPGAESDDGGLEVAVERIGFARATVPVGPDSAADGVDAISADIRLTEETLALAEVAVTGASAPWTPVDRERAEEIAGFSVHRVPELEILEIEAGEIDGTPVLRVRQAVRPGAVLNLVESRNPVSGPAAGLFSLPSDSTVTTVTTRRGEVWITGSAPVPADSLRALVEAVR